MAKKCKKKKHEYKINRVSGSNERRRRDSNPRAGMNRQTHFECAALRPLRYVSNYTGASTRNTCIIIPDFSLFVIYYFCFYSVFLFRNAFSLRHLLRHFLRNFPDQEDITFHLDCIHPHFRRADRNRRPDISRFIINRCADSDCF